MDIEDLALNNLEWLIYHKIQPTLPSCIYVNTTEWLHRIDFKKTPREKAIWEL